MTWGLWGWYLLTATVSAISPGPAVFLVVAQALQGGRSRAFWASLGILSVNAMFFVLAAFGLGAMLAASRQLFMVMKWIGAAYLVYLGIRTFLGQSSLSLATEVARESESDTGESEATKPLRMWMRGMVLQMANPKAFIFVTALLPQFIHSKTAVPQQMAILGVTSIVAELFVLSGYGALAGRLSSLAQQPKFVKVTNRVSGALLVSAGTGVALVSAG